MHIDDIPICNREPDKLSQLKRILKAQILLCELDGVSPVDEPFIQELRREIMKIEINALK